MLIPLPLTFLQPGQSGRIHSFIGADDQVHRLNELGLKPGTVVEMLQSGNPCILRIEGSKYCFRHGEALGVMVCQDDECEALR